MFKIIAVRRGSGINHSGWTALFMLSVFCCTLNALLCCQPHIYGIVRPPPLLVSRHVVGTGQERGGIVTTLRNAGTSSSLTVAYLDTIPWYLRLYLHIFRWVGPNTRHHSLVPAPLPTHSQVGSPLPGGWGVLEILPQCSGFVFDPYSLAFYIRIGISNVDLYSRKTGGRVS